MQDCANRSSSSIVEGGIHRIVISTLGIPDADAVGIGDLETEVVAIFVITGGSAGGGAATIGGARTTAPWLTTGPLGLVLLCAVSGTFADSMMGPMFDKGLTKLKAECEAK